MAGTPLLAPPSWRLPAPVPLDSVRLEFRPDAPPPDAPDLAALAPHLLPGAVDGARYHRYSEVIGRLGRPSVFENRPVYRLIEADLADLAGPPGPGWPSGAGRYFDAIDAGGAGHEYAAARTPPGRRRRLRSGPRSAARSAWAAAARRWRSAR